MYEEVDSSPISQLEAKVINVVSEVQVCEKTLSDKEAKYLQDGGSKLGRFSDLSMSKSDVRCISHA